MATSSALTLVGARASLPIRIAADLATLVLAVTFVGLPWIVARKHDRSFG